MSHGPEELGHEYFESELVIGLVAAVGAETGPIIELLTETLSLAGYAVKLVKISKQVIHHLAEPESYGSDNFKRYQSYMDAGNKAREAANDPSILATGAASIIAEYRRQIREDEMSGMPASTDAQFNQGRPSAESVPKTAFIIDSLKRPEEIDKLRVIYSTGFLLLGIHSELERRVRYLVNAKGMKRKKALHLIERDRSDRKDDYGQLVNKTFHLADCFVHLTGSHDRMRCDLKRIIELCFGSPFITPTFDEMAMFHAFSSSLRSADLSRQVGAVIARDNQILATGANDCPQAGGGLYWPKREAASSCIADEPNGRDFQRGYDSNKREQRQISKRIAKSLAGRFKLKEWKPIRDELLKGDIRDLTEFGRVVHAEMEALLSCSRQGIITAKADLYSTTFPCHNCAKHIIAAGISRVVYVEPYPKSKALEFHSEAILTSESKAATNRPRVLFEPFVGIGPRRFFELFSMHLGSSYAVKRKDPDSGKKVAWTIASGRLRTQMKPLSYLNFENLAERYFLAKVKSLNTFDNGDKE
jgi:deoxycytidylate deaminase